MAIAVTITVDYASGQRNRFDAGAALCSDVCLRSVMFSGEDDDGNKVTWRAGAYRAGDRLVWESGGKSNHEETKGTKE